MKLNHRSTRHMFAVVLLVVVLTTACNLTWAPRPIFQDALTAIALPTGTPRPTATVGPFSQPEPPTMAVPNCGQPDLGWQILENYVFPPEWTLISTGEPVDLTNLFANAEPGVMEVYGVKNQVDDMRSFSIFVCPTGDKLISLNLLP